MADFPPSEPIALTVEARAHGWRLDHYLGRLFPNYSRTSLQRAIETHAVLVNGLPAKPARRLRVNDCISVSLPAEPDSSLPAENIPLDILFEDESLVVINKPPDMIVHPGRGNYRGTLAGALQFHFDQLSDIAGKLRPGIVHRLDRDTSGVLVVAKDNQVHHRLSGQFERREVTKVYRAITWGVMELDSDFIETFVRVHSRHREKMQVCPSGGNARHAVTFYEVIDRFDGFTHVRLAPKTGRTHQLRIHMQYLGHPIVADRVYGGQETLRLSELNREPNSSPGGSNQKDDVAPSTVDSEHLKNSDDLISRQALHAHRLEFRHPRSGKPMEFEAPLPDDFQRTLEALHKYRTPER